MFKNIISIAVFSLIFSSTAFAALNGTLTGSGHTPSSDVQGTTVFGGLTFTFNADNTLDQVASFPVHNKPVSQTSKQSIECVNPGDIIEIGGNQYQEIFFSGTYISAEPDPRVSAAENAQAAEAIDQGNYLVAGVIYDSLVPGIPDKRSLFLSSMNFKVSMVGPVGSFSSPLGVFDGATGADLCLEGNALFTTADLIRKTGPSKFPLPENQLGTIAFLDAETGEIGPKIANTPENVNNPPANAILSLQGITRTLDSGNIVYTP